jgi:superkiller protein 3
MITSLVHHFPPKHHPRALGIIEPVLAKEPDNIPCLLGHAYILRYSRKYAEGKSLFAGAARLVNKEEDHLSYLEAVEEVAWCDSLSKNYQDACEGLRSIIDELDDIAEHSARKARVWWRLGQTLWNQNRPCSSLNSFFWSRSLT